MLQFLLSNSCCSCYYLNYNVQNVRTDTECKFEFKLNVLMQCTVKFGSHGQPNG